MSGRVLVIFGLILVALGVLFEFAPMLRLGRLPGDISFGGSGWRVYIPIGTSIVISIVLTVVFSLVTTATTRK